MTSPAAVNFIFLAIQEHGQLESDRVLSVQGVLDAAGFDATATCWPVFGGIWPKPCVGRDAEAASSWLKTLTETMKRGDANEEFAHVEAMIETRKAGLAQR